MLKLCVGIQRKEGRPDYGSAGATLSMEFEIAATPGDAQAIGEQVKAAYDLLNALADDELARQCGRTEAPAAAPEPAKNGHATNGAPPRRPQVATPRTVPGQHRNGGAFRHVQGGPPRDGRQLFAWARREQENGSKGLIDWLADFGRAQGYPDKITTWDSVQTAEALAEVMQGAS